MKLILSQGDYSNMPNGYEFSLSLADIGLRVCFDKEGRAWTKHSYQSKEFMEALARDIKGRVGWNS